ncbi:MAG: hypothetical protein JST05_05655 [Acidobacteria bacterium]|nr:hypothetical protein [Acidobacteriota bacterium]
MARIRILPDHVANQIAAGPWREARSGLRHEQGASTCPARIDCERSRW